MRASRLGVAAIAGALAAFAVGCGGGERPVKIGVLTDCQGPFHAFEEAQLAGAELPLLDRGATMRGTAPTDGLTAATVAGRKVELVRGCAETGEYTVFIEEARRLVEKERVDAVVGGAGTVIRDVARLYPTVPFVATFWDEQEVTLRAAPPNLYRYELDYGQQAAGLGRYAYDDLGWRRASVLASDSTQGWGATAAFVAEFCALGGTIVDQVYLSPFTPLPDPGAAVQKGAPDGVAFLLSSYDSPIGPARSVTRRLSLPPRQLLLSSPLIEDSAVRAALGRRLDGVVSTSFIPVGHPSKVLADYRRHYAAAFPGLPPDLADTSFVVGYSDSVEAALVALENVDGDVSDGRRRLREALASLRLELPRGAVRLDHQRQAVADVPLVRLRWQGGKSTIEPIRTARNVEQTFGGILSSSPPPGPASQPCVRAKPPAWARK